MVRPEHIQKFIDSLDEMTIILIDLSFVVEEFVSLKEFYSDLYSGNEPDYPKKQFPSIISATDLIGNLCHYGNARRNLSYSFIFAPPGTEKFIEVDAENSHLIKCNDQPIWVEMEKLISANTEITRIIIVADSKSYIPLINTLLSQEYKVGLIKHRQEGSNDWSNMPPELPYQFSDYPIGRCLGLDQGEL